jgi:hypothetical protein
VTSDSQGRRRQDGRRRTCPRHTAVRERAAAASAQPGAPPCRECAILRHRADKGTPCAAPVCAARPEPKCVWERACLWFRRFRTPRRKAPQVLPLPGYMDEHACEQGLAALRQLAVEMDPAAAAAAPARAPAPPLNCIRAGTSCLRQLTVAMPPPPRHRPI